MNFIKQYFLQKKLEKNNIFIKNHTYVNKKTVFLGNNHIGDYTSLANCFIGKYSYIGEQCNFRDTSIGNFCSIGNNISVIYGKHPLDFVSTHPLFYCCDSHFKKQFLKENIFKNLDAKKFQVEIGHDVWIGTDVRIKEGIKIGNGAVIATGAVVVKDVPPYAIVGGVPAKLIKYRFSSDEIQAIEKSQWWNKDDFWLKENAIYFNNVEIFLDKIKNS